MSFEAFRSGVRKKCGRAEFKHEDGMHIALLPEGIRITGNAISTKVLVEWGSGHSAFAVL